MRKSPPSPPSTRTTTPLRVRLLPGEQLALRRAAARAGLPLAVWARDALLAAAGLPPAAPRPRGRPPRHAR